MTETQTFEVWCRSANGDKVQTQVNEALDALSAVRTALEKFNIKPENVRELRVKHIPA